MGRPLPVYFFHLFMVTTNTRQISSPSSSADIPRCLWSLSFLSHLLCLQVKYLCLSVSRPPFPLLVQTLSLQTPSPIPDPTFLSLSPRQPFPRFLFTFTPLPLPTRHSLSLSRFRILRIFRWKVEKVHLCKGRRGHVCGKRS